MSPNVQKLRFIGFQRQKRIDDRLKIFFDIVHGRVKAKKLLLLIKLVCRRNRSGIFYSVLLRIRLEVLSSLFGAPHGYASCHLALGKAYPTTIKDGDTLTKGELSKLGANDSIEHVDFMIGSKDMNITGITEAGEEIKIFVDGDWII